MCLSAVACLLGGTAPVAAQFHQGDLGVARTSAGKLRVVGWSGDPVLLPPVNGLLVGWADNDPGFDRIDVDVPEEDVFRLQTGTQIRLEAEMVSGAFKVWAANLASQIDSAGQSLPLGDHNLHTHLVWHIDSTDPLFQSGQSVWTATFRLIDTGTTQYTPSDPFEMTFTNVSAAVPAMSSWGVCILILLVLSGGTIVLQPRAGRAAPRGYGPMHKMGMEG